MLNNIANNMSTKMKSESISMCIILASGCYVLRAESIAKTNKMQIN